MSLMFSQDSSELVAKTRENTGGVVLNLIESFIML